MEVARQPHRCRMYLAVLNRLSRIPHGSRCHGTILQQANDTSAAIECQAYFDTINDAQFATWRQLCQSKVPLLRHCHFVPAFSSFSEAQLGVLLSGCTSTSSWNVSRPFHRPRLPRRCPQTPWEMRCDFRGAPP